MMDPWVIFAIRFVMSAVFAVLLSRFFFRDGSFVKIVLLGLALLGFAYLFEYFRKRREGESNGK